LLFNINTVELNHVNVAKKSKEELKKELEKAISNENYEMAKIINNKLKELE
jgi:protein-arginine kinase activator protein McsA